MGCDICGKEGELLQAKIEGTVMSVCSGCAKYGKVIRQAVVEKIEVKKPKFKIEKEESVEIVALNYSEIIKNAREKKGLKQEELAQKLNLKASVINNIERKKFKPDPTLAKKLEKFLSIVLVQEYEEEKLDGSSKKSSSFTLGDFIKKK